LIYIWVPQTLHVSSRVVPDTC